MSFSESHVVETYKSLISLSTEALKALLLLNGGAVVALLAFLGQVKSGPEIAPHMMLSMAFFVAGLIAAGSAFATAYITQLTLYNESIHLENYSGLKHHVWLVTTVVLGALSILMFASGGLFGVFALSHATMR